MSHCSREFSDWRDYQDYRALKPWNSPDPEDGGWRPDRANYQSVLAGRPGRSRPPGHAFLPVLVAAILMVSMFPQGLALWPLIMVAMIGISLSRRNVRHHPGRGQHHPVADQEWSTTRTGPAAPAASSAPVKPTPAKPAVANSQSWPTPHPAVRSPFEQPAFWDTDTTAGISVTKAPGATPRTTPPTWDPLGVAPFAWDLPEPPPLRQPVTWRRPSAVERVTGFALITAALAAIGDFAGWWPLSWAAGGTTAVVALAVLALAASLRVRVGR
jgi:hypothetical protein